MLLTAVETPVLVQLIAGTVTVMTAAIGAVAAYFALKQGQKNNVVALETKAQVLVVDKKAEQIHDLTNSNLSKVTSQLDVANAEIKGMKDLIAGIIAEREKGDKTAQNIQLDRIENSVVRNPTNIPVSATTEKPVPVVDDKLADIMTPKLDKIQETVDNK